MERARAELKILLEGVVNVLRSMDIRIQSLEMNDEGRFGYEKDRKLIEELTQQLERLA